MKVNYSIFLRVRIKFVKLLFKKLIIFKLRRDIAFKSGCSISAKYLPQLNILKFQDI